MRLAVIGLAVLATATAAVGQSRYGSAPSPSSRLPGITADADSAGVRRDTGEVRREIRRGRASGTLTKREARGLRRETRQVDALTDRYGADGLSASERAELETRARVLRDVTNAQRTAGAGRRP